MVIDDVSGKSSAFTRHENGNFRLTTNNFYYDMVFITGKTSAYH